MSKNTAKVKFFDRKRGFGFLLDANGGPDVFVHISAIESNTPLDEGQTVQYDLGKDRNERTVAVNVKQVA